MIEMERLEFIKEFLQENCAGREEAWEIVNLLEFQALADARPLLQAKKDIADLLSQDLHDNTILELVTQYATIKLENPTNENATAWLKWLAKQIDREINENLLPFQPIRAKLERILAPADKKYPHDLLLYPSDEPLPEYWCVVWYRDVFYEQFLKEWDGETCPACQTLTIKKKYEEKYKGGTMEWGSYSATAYYDKFIVYRCSNCQLGWTESNGSETVVDTSYP